MTYLGDAVRQWGQPREFRIHRPAWPAEALAVLADLARCPPEGPQPPEEPLRPERPEPEGIADRSVADLATSLWRLRGRAARLPSEQRPVTRHAERAWDALEQAGVQVNDHVNEPFDGGLSLTVAGWQPTTGLDRERVIEAIRPSVYLGDRVIQAAEVIVGVPEPASDGPVNDDGPVNEREPR